MGDLHVVHHSLIGIAKAALRTAADFLYPPVCIVCGCLSPERVSPVCAECWDGMTAVNRELPLFCETRDRLRAEEVVDDLVACVVFEKGGAFQRIAHAIKYQSMERLAVELGRRLGKRIRQHGLVVDLVVPVPLHRIKFRERGYNQSERIACGIADVCGWPVIPDAVVRTRYTGTQTALGVEERRKNVHDAFRCVSRRRTQIDGRRCLLVDDVITTGATTTACARALRQAGATAVIAASIALAQHGADQT